MEYIYAALVLHKAGKEVTESSLKAVLTAAGAIADDGQVRALVAALHGVNIDETIKNAAPLAAAPAAAAAAPKTEEKKEKKEEKKPEEAAAGLGSLFG